MNNARNSEKNKKCPVHPIDICKNRERINCNNLKFPWNQDPNGYFLVKINKKKKTIHCGFVNNKHKMISEFWAKAKNTGKIIKEIAKRKIVKLEQMGYIASELERAKFCLENNKEYIQR